ncbi:MAG: YCF48-related protein [Amphritea sp.]
MKTIINSTQKRLYRFPLARLVAALLITVGSSCVLADYQDPLDMPALEMGSAPQSLLLDVAQAGDRLVAVGERGHILYSDDLGANWTQAEVAVRSQLNAVYFLDAQRGWAVGEDALILHTTDGGLTWQKQFDARDAEMKGPLLDLYFKNADEGFAVGVFNKFYHTVDGGKHWQAWQEHADNLDEWHLFAMASPVEGTIYVASESGLLFRSLDDGESFAPLQTVHDGSFHGILAKRGADGLDRLVLSGVGGKLFTSVDSGESWTELDTQTEAGLSGGTWLADGSALIVGADGILLKVSSDLSSVQKFQRDNGLPLSSVMNISEDKLVLVGLGGIQTLNAGEVTHHD